MPTITLFLQFEGDRRIELIQADENAPVRELIDAAVRAGLAAEHKDGALVFAHECDDPLDLNVALVAAGVRDKDRVHVHRCRKVEVTVHFNDVTKKYQLTPSTTVHKVKREFVKDIRMPEVDATEHVLQLCGSTDRPEPDMHIGCLAKHCSLCFDLVPIKRVEG